MPIPCPATSQALVIPGLLRMGQASGSLYFPVGNAKLDTFLSGARLSVRLAAGGVVLVIHCQAAAVLLSLYSGNISTRALTVFQLYEGLGLLYVACTESGSG